MPGGARLGGWTVRQKHQSRSQWWPARAATCRAERGFLAASLQLTSEQAVADIGLHTPDTALTDATIDVSAGANQVTIALTHPARARDRRTVWALLAELFDAVAEAP